MSILRVFDCSQYISAGAVATRRVSAGVREVNGRFSANDMPSGGIAYMMSAVDEFYNEDDTLVFCFDTTPSIKREMHAMAFPQGLGYKGNRPKHDPSIPVQRKACTEILRDCGFNVFAQEGYEADDLITAVVREYKDDFDKVIVHSRDSDLYFLVDDKVSIAPIGSRGKYINMDNWRESVNSKYFIEYNTLLYNKMVFGETGDNVPALSIEAKDRIEANLPKELWPRLGDIEFARKVLHEAVGLDDRRSIAIIDLILPLNVDRSDVELCETEFDKRKFVFYAHKVGAKNYWKDNSITYSKGEELLEDFINEYNDCI